MNESKNRILIATSDHEMARAYADRLGSSHFDVRQSTSEAGLLQDSLDFQPEIILLDAQFTGGGHDLLDILRHTPETEHTIIILLATLVDPALQTRARALGVSDVLIKSRATIADVIARVHHHLRRPRTGSLR